MTLWLARPGVGVGDVYLDGRVTAQNIDYLIKAIWGRFGCASDCSKTKEEWCQKKHFVPNSGQGSGTPDVHTLYLVRWPSRLR